LSGLSLRKFMHNHAISPDCYHERCLPHNLTQPLPETDTVGELPGEHPQGVCKKAGNEFWERIERIMRSFTHDCVLLIREICVKNPLSAIRQQYPLRGKKGSGDEREVMQGGNLG
jgi:hypothetical protein